MDSGDQEVRKALRGMVVGQEGYCNGKLRGASDWGVDGGSVDAFG